MRLLLLIILSVSVSISYAQSTVDLDPVSITSSRTAQRISETGRNITIIPGSTIEKLPVSSLDELLKYAGSVEVQQRGPAGAQADIVIRGGTFQQVLVLLDGIKINDPITGHFSAYMPIVPSQIDRIEILKGPAAATYGSEAVGGVINIISKTFASSSTEKYSKTNASVAAGEYGYLSAHAGFEHNNKKVHYSLGVLSNNADGQLLRGNNRGYFHNNTYSANMAISLNEQWKLMLHSSYDTRDFAAQNFYTTFASDTATEQVNSWWNHLKLRYSKGKSTNELDVAYKKSSDEYLYNKLSTANKNKSDLLSIQFIHQHKVSETFSYNAGVLSEIKKITSNDRGDHNNNNLAAFSSLVYKQKQLTLSPGIRLVHDDNYGTEFLPQANIAYRIGRINLKANAGRAIRSADFTERYNNYNKALVTGGSVGNPDLTAERSWSYEAGADLLLKSFRFSTAYFYRDQNDVIDFVTTPYSEMPRKDNLSPTGTFALARNIKSVRTSGVEMEAYYACNFSGNSNFSVNATATFLHSKAPGATGSFYIISHAKTLLQQTLSYRYKNLGITLNSIFKERGPQSAPGIGSIVTRQYWVVNTKITYTYKIANAFISVNNIGNVQYVDLLGSRMPGSWVTGGLGVNF